MKQLEKIAEYLGLTKTPFEKIRASYVQFGSQSESIYIPFSIPFHKKSLKGIDTKAPGYDLLHTLADSTNRPMEIVALTSRWGNSSIKIGQFTHECELAHGIEIFTTPSRIKFSFKVDDADNGAFAKLAIKYAHRMPDDNRFAPYPPVTSPFHEAVAQFIVDVSQKNMDLYDRGSA